MLRSMRRSILFLACVSCTPAAPHEPVALTAREFELLTLFITHPRHALTREQIFEQVWGSWGDRSAVSVYVRRLRDKLEADPRHPQLLVTVWGVGYRFDPPAAR